MSVDEGLSFVCAAAAAGGNATANVMQRKASLEQPAHRAFGPGLLRNLIYRPTWLLGFGGMVASFVLQALALGFGQLVAVESVITLEVPLTLLVASRVFAVGVGRAEWTGIWAMTIGMIVLVGMLNPHPGNEADVSRPVYLAAGAGTVGCVALLVAAGQRGRRLWRSGCLGAAAGTSFGLTATLIKETVARLSTAGIPAVLATWQTYAAVGVGAAGVVIMQWALHVGPLLAAQPGITLMDPLVSILWGLLVYHETVRTGLWLLPAFAGAATIIGAMALLTHSPLLAALDEDALDSRIPGPRNRTGVSGEQGSGDEAPRAGWAHS